MGVSEPSFLFYKVLICIVVLEHDMIYPSDNIGRLGKEKGCISMTSEEAIRYHLKKLKGKPLKQNLEYVITYFWVPILTIVLLLLFISSYIINLVTTKDSALNIICMNSYAEDGNAESFITEYAQRAGIDLAEYTVNITAGMSVPDDTLIGSFETSQILFAQIAAQDIDLIVSSQDLSNYIYQEAFAELPQVLSAEQQTRYEQYYLYMDKAFLKSLDGSYTGTLEYPDPTKPELMEEPVPVALRLPDNSEFQQLYYPYKPGEVVVGILSNSLNTNNALLFLDFIMQ